MTKPKAAALKVERRKLAHLKPAERNARVHPSEQIERLAKSLAEYGWTNPILVDAKNEIVAGHGRYLAALSIRDAKGQIPRWSDVKDAPVIVLKDLTDAQRRAYRIADNRLPELSRWDDDLLKLEAIELKGVGLDLDLVGFGDLELAPPADAAAFLDGIGAPDAIPSARSTGEFVQLAFTVTPDVRKDILAVLRDQQAKRSLPTAAAALHALCRELRV